MKAFITSILAIIISALLLSLWLSITTTSLQFQNAVEYTTPLSYSNSFFDSVAQNINLLIGPNATLEKHNQTIVFSVDESFPKGNISAILSSYDAFIQNNLSVANHINATINFSGVSDGTMEIYLFDNYIYLHNYTNSSANEIIFTGMQAQKTNASEYNITISTSKARSTLSQLSLDPSGDLRINLIYNDANGTIIQSGNVSSGSSNHFMVLYTGNETLDITVGKVMGGDGSISIKDGGAFPHVNLAISLPLQDPEKKQVLAYNIFVNYSQGNIFKNAQLEK